MSNRSHFANNLNYLIKKYGLTFSRVNKATAIPRSTIHNWTEDNGNLKFRIELVTLVTYFKRLGEKDLSLEKILLENLGNPTKRNTTEKIDRNKLNQLELFG